MLELEFCEHWVGQLTFPQIDVLNRKIENGLFVGVGREVGGLSQLPLIQRSVNSDFYHIINAKGELGLASKDGINLYVKKDSNKSETKMPNKNFSGETILTQYIKKGVKNRKVGMFYAVRWQSLTPSKPSYILMGHSLCDHRDKFSKTKAFEIAQGRAVSQNPQRLPSSIEKEFNEFHTRCKKFFKDTEFLENYHGYVLQYD